jgi:head-tail adaptor
LGGDRHRSDCLGGGAGRAAEPGRSSGDGIETARQPARIRLRWRDDITSAMRIVVDDGRVMQIVSGPAEIYGRRKWMELMAEEYSSAGDVV